jgi:hypothetical protein
MRIENTTDDGCWRYGLTAEEGLGDDLSAQFAVTKIKTFCFIVYKRMLILVKTFNVDLFF